MNSKKYRRAGCIFLAMVFAFTAGRISTRIISEQNANREEDSDEKSICGRYEYEIVEQDGTVRIRAYLGEELIVFIPETLDGRKISVIGHEAFSGNSTMERVILPSGIKKVEWGAFTYCSRLETVILGKGVEEIQASVFSFCPSLTEIRFSEGLTEIGNGVCAYCPQLEKIYIPKSVEKIRDSAFEGCPDLKLVYGSSAYAEIYAQQKGLVYVDENRIEEEGNLVW